MNSEAPMSISPERRYKSFDEIGREEDLHSRSRSRTRSPGRDLPGPRRFGLPSRDEDMRQRSRSRSRSVNPQTPESPRSPDGPISDFQDTIFSGIVPSITDALAAAAKPKSMPSIPALEKPRTTASTIAESEKQCRSVSRSRSRSRSRQPPMTPIDESDEPSHSTEPIVAQGLKFSILHRHGRRSGRDHDRDVHSMPPPLHRHSNLCAVTFIPSALLFWLTIAKVATDESTEDELTGSSD